MAEGNNNGPEAEASALEQAQDKSLKNTWKEKAKNLPLKYKIGAAGAALAALAGGAVGINKAAEGDNQTDSNVSPTPVERTIEPTVEPTQVVEITPTPMQETPKTNNWEIEILPPTDPDHPANERYKVEETQAIIESILEKYPPIGNLKIQIGLGGGSYLNPDGTIKIDRASPNIDVDFRHELFHSWDKAVLNNPELFPVNLQADLIVKRANILNDMQIGRAYPDFDKLIFSSDGVEPLRKFRTGEKLSLEDLGALSSYEVNSFWIYDEDTTLNSLFSDEQFDQRSKSPDIKQYATFSEFLNGESAFLDSLAQRNSLWKINLEDIRSNIPKYETAAKKLNASNYLEKILIIARLRSAQEIYNGDLQISQNMNPKDFEMVKLETSDLVRGMDREKIAYLVSQYLYLLDNRRLSEESPLIGSYIESLLQK